MSAFQVVAVAVDLYGVATEGVISVADEAEGGRVKAGFERDLVEAGWQVDGTGTIWTKAGVGGWSEVYVEAEEQG